MRTLRCAGCPFPSLKILSRSIIYVFCLPFLSLIELEAELGVSFAKMRPAHLFEAIELSVFCFLESGMFF